MRKGPVSRALPAAGWVLLGLAAVIAVAQVNPAGAATVYTVVAAVSAFVAAAYAIWYVEPVYIFCAAILLSPISGYWSELGVPGFASLDRLLLVAGITAVAIKAPGARGRPAIRIAPVHWVMLAAISYVVLSALLANTLFDRPSFFRLLEAFGILPFLVFLVAPVVFRTPRERDILLRTLVALGLYLSLTTFFERFGLNALVFPQYILDPNIGTHAGRGRGPFAEAVTNGFALYVCAVASIIAFARWRRTQPLFARICLWTAALAVGGAFMSQQRSVWLGALVATVVAATTIGEARKHAPAILAMLALVVGGSLLLIPGLAAQVQERGNQQDTVWDRKNLARAAVNMVEERPLFGFGWSQFTRASPEYFEQADGYPLAPNISRLRVHNVPLNYEAELGLVGLMLWAAVLITGVGGALATRGPPDLAAWRAGLLAVAVCYVVVSNFVPPSVFPNLVLWLWAGVVWSGRYGPPDEPPARGPHGSAGARTATL